MSWKRCFIFSNSTWNGNRNVGIQEKLCNFQMFRSECIAHGFSNHIKIVLKRINVKIYHIISMTQFCFSDTCCGLNVIQNRFKSLCSWQVSSIWITIEDCLNCVLHFDYPAAYPSTEAFKHILPNSLMISNLCVWNGKHELDAAFL